MMNTTAYCDESFDEQHTRVFVIAGYVGSLTRWQDFDRSWKVALQRDNLQEFKASDCEHERGQYRGWSKGYRRGCYERFVSLIRGSGLMAIGVAIDLEAYEPYRGEIKRLRKRSPDGRKPPARFDDPYYVGFQHILDQVIDLMDNTRLPPEEKAAFVFDVRDGFVGNALALFDSMQTDSRGERLQSVIYAQSEDCPGLQAADILAFEMRRHFEDVAYKRTNRGQRWQWDRLTKGTRGGVDLWHLDETSMPTLMEVMREQWGGDSHPKESHPHLA